MTEETINDSWEEFEKFAKQCDFIYFFTLTEQAENNQAGNNTEAFFTIPALIQSNTGKTLFGRCMSFFCENENAESMHGLMNELGIRDGGVGSFQKSKDGKMEFHEGIFTNGHTKVKSYTYDNYSVSDLPKYIKQSIDMNADIQKMANGVAPEDTINYTAISGECIN